MTRTEFEEAVPYILNHQSSGIGFLETQEFHDGDKSAQYRDQVGCVFGGCTGKTWSEVYEQMQGYLQKMRELKVIE